MWRKTLTLAAALAAMALSACQDGDNGRRVAGICKAFPAANAPAAGGAAVVEDCLHRWGYALAASADDAATVADAVVAACTAPLARWNQQTLTAAGEARLQDAPSLLTGENTNPILEHGAFAHGRALFYVVQARAGGCKPPPRRAAASKTADQAMTSPDQ